MAALSDLESRILRSPQPDTHETSSEAATRPHQAKRPRILAAAETASARRWDLPPMMPPDTVAPARQPETDPLAPEPPTAEELTAIRDLACEEGYQAGFTRGMAEAQERLEAESRSLKDLLEALARPLAAVDEQVVRELLGLTCDIARQLIRRELTTEPGQIVAVVRETLALLPLAERHIVLQLHPDDAALVERVLVRDHEGTPWRIEEDPLLTRGGCRVLNGDSSIDATVESRIGAAIARVLGDPRRSGDSP